MSWHLSFLLYFFRVRVCFLDRTIGTSMPIQCMGHFDGGIVYLTESMVFLCNYDALSSVKWRAFETFYIAPGKSFLSSITLLE